MILLRWRFLPLGLFLIVNVVKCQDEVTVTTDGQQEDTTDDAGQYDDETSTMESIRPLLMNTMVASNQFNRTTEVKPIINTFNNPSISPLAEQTTQKIFYKRPIVMTMLAPNQINKTTEVIPVFHALNTADGKPVYNTVSSMNHGKNSNGKGKPAKHNFSKTDKNSKGNEKSSSKGKDKFEKHSNGGKKEPKKEEHSAGRVNKDRPRDKGNKGKGEKVNHDTEDDRNIKSGKNGKREGSNKDKNHNESARNKPNVERKPNDRFTDGESSKGHTNSNNKHEGESSKHGGVKNSGKGKRPANGTLDNRDE